MDNIRVVQVTDCHLQENADDPFKGFNPEQRLLNTLQQLRSEDADSDLLLLSGDLVHHGYASGYQRLQRYTDGMAKEVRWIPGNHDDAARMREYQALFEKVFVQGDWCIIMLDSTAEPDGKGGGALSQTELDWLASVVAEHADKYLLLVLHHPPVAVGSQWQDSIMLANAEAFWTQLKKYKNLKLIVCGHLHQAHQIEVGQVCVLATPATAPQFKVSTVEPEIESDPYLSQPAYRVIDLLPDGKYTTRVKRVPV
ncbi:metallophosphoesterase [Neptunomonas sp.]|uniref:metallophosphoesterase n=1 Tax=Neptunomonas sp. TaxID=1971898 RepID=UPI003567995B